MPDFQIRDYLARVDPDRLRADIHYLSANPLPRRVANYTIPGHDRSTLDETDDFIAGRMAALGYPVTREAVAVQAFRCDMAKVPKHTWYSPPLPDDPWYTAYNLYAERRGAVFPDEIILLCAHKDSQSWIASPGAYDNAVGTAGLLEIARALADTEPRRTIRWLWCNEEHSPWTSVYAAQQAAARGDNLVAIVNVDSVGGRSPEAIAAGRRTNVTLYTEAAGRPMAELMGEVNAAYGIGLEQSIQQRPGPGDDDGSFVKAGYPHAVMNLGSFPYAHEHYHQEGDVAAAVDVLNVAMAIQMTLGALLRVDRDGAP